ncbi:MAG: carbohydrate ABC transporter permease [Deferribacteres bacterium]|nr:carbohydrate ABC transporter permease [candidate division KSB1 bacterium]MCB9501459.1 carbohydrate ABC transporter permease [Deferribacteres bacterium]
MDYRLKKKFTSIGLHIVVILGAILTILPFLWMIGASLMETGESASFPPKFIPESATLKQYLFLFQRMNLARYFLNSLVLSIGVTIVSLVVNSMAGFAFAKFHFRGKTNLFKLLLSSMIIPGQVTMLPVFLLLNKLGLLNSYFGIILPGMASIFGIFLIRQYLSSIPDSLLEAAYIDGANDFYIYWKIIIPLSMPILVTLALFTFMGTWNDFLWPLIVMSDESMYTLPVALANLSKEFDLDPELMMAGSVITVLPVIIVFLLLQKYYIRGILIGGVKE